MEEHPGKPTHHIQYPKLAFPTFNREEPKEWSSKCKQYYMIYQIPKLQWVEIATMHFSSRAHKWKEGYLIDKPNINWDELVEAACRRFEGLEIKRLVKEFNKLMQTSTLERY